MADFNLLVQLLIQRHFRISAAESCTGGKFAAAVVDVPDASKVLSASFITYSEEAKTALVGVPSEIISRYGVVSEEVAYAMAKGAAAAGRADVGVGITGFAGPAGGTASCPVGTVCFGISIQGETRTYTRRFGNIGRNLVRDKAVSFAADQLIGLLQA